MTTRFTHGTLTTLTAGLLTVWLGSIATAEPATESLSLPLSSPDQPQDAEVIVGPIAETPYVLGVGDEIQIDIFNVPEFSAENGQYVVPVDGTLRLPWVDRVNVQGLTIDEAETAIEQAYAPFLNEPDVTLNLLVARPLTVAVLGEVDRPGTYALRFDEGTASELSVDRAAQWPNVTQAIQLAGGITQTADIRDIRISRQRLGSDRAISVNLWALLKDGEITQDINLRDGDTIMVPKATALGPAELTQLADANFSPDMIGVNVVGEVVTPGLVEVEPNTTLNQAILAAGGFTDARARRRRVDLVRLNPDGTVAKRRINVDLTSGVDEEENPPLRPGDVVIVNRNGMARTSDALELFLNPFSGVVNLIDDVFEIFD